MSVPSRNAYIKMEKNFRSSLIVKIDLSCYNVWCNKTAFFKKCWFLLNVYSFKDNLDIAWKSKKGILTTLDTGSNYLLLKSCWHFLWYHWSPKKKASNFVEKYWNVYIFFWFGGRGSLWFFCFGGSGVRISAFLGVFENFP